MIDTPRDTAHEQEPAPAPAPKSFHHGDLRRALIEAANEILAEEGLDGLTLRKLALRIGVSHAAPYHHFEDKAAVLAAVAEMGFARLTEALQAATTAAGTDPFARLTATGRTYVAFALAHPGYFAVMFRPDLSRPAANPGVDQASGGAFQHLVEVMGECLGDRTPVEVRDHLVLTAWSAVHGAAELLVHGPLGRKSAGLGIPPDALATRIPAMITSLVRTAVAAGLTGAAGHAWLAAATATESRARD